ncbi:hypothetical protein [Streptomyces ginkgonis]|uniref:hypothetical protein n=1 Tax=Streptomyces ginkgonis TaxID=1812259 RepID=UPI002176B74E|nr:hypothetical protein [Streptomyces ginkgonis]
MTVARGPIKVGSGFIDIEPKVSREALRTMRSNLLTQMSTLGTAAGREFSRAATKGISEMPRAAATAARRAQRSVRQEARDTDATLRGLERQLTREYGQQAAQRFRTFRDMEIQRRQAVEGTSLATRSALRQTAKAEEDERRASARRSETAERERRRLIREREREAVQAERAQSRAHEQAQRAMRQQLRSTMEAARQERQRDLRHQVDTSTDHASTLRRQLQEYRQQVRDLESGTTSSLAGIRREWRSQSIHLERLGTTATEAGNLITRNLLAPLGLVAGALTTIGVRSADSLILGQMGLVGAGVSPRDSADALERIRQYGVDTPYSIEDMQKYMARYIRGIISHDPDHKSEDPALREAAGRRASQRAADIVEMVGDNAARSGNLDPAMVDRAMYAIDMILDIDRVPTRNLKQFVANAGVPVQELALLLGFEDTPQSAASDQMLRKMAAASKTGGVQGQDLINALLEDWASEGGARGYARQVGTSTIGGRIQQMKETAQVKLGDLFVQRNAESGEYEYTGLGEALMGTKVIGDDGSVSYEGGLLNEVAGIGRMALPHLGDFLTTFFEVLSTFTDWIRNTVAWLNDHPGFRDAVLQFAKIAALATPFLLGFGLLTKLVGKFGKLLGAALAPVSGLISGAVGAGRVLSQVRAGASSRRNGGSFLDGYRDRRTQLRGGDDRGPLRRTADRMTGRNSQTDRINREMRDLERQIREADRRTGTLRRSLREVNSTSLAQVTSQLSGPSRSIRSGADQARGSVRQIDSQGLKPLNRASLSAVQRQLSDLRQRSEAAGRSLRDTGRDVSQLNNKRLGSLRSQQIDTTERRVSALARSVRSAGDDMGRLNRRSLAALRNEFSQLSTRVTDARRKTSDASTAVTNLNRKRLTGLRNEFKGSASSLYNAANEVYKKIGTTTGTSSVNGRIATLNTRKLTSVKRQVDNLKDALNKAKNKANDLDSAIGRVNTATRISGGNSGSGNSSRGNRRYAQGGILPGYAPGVDSVPALLSPGEAVLRPEVAHHLGAARIDSWNQAAVRGQLSRYASGTSGAGGKSPNAALSMLLRQRDVFNISSIVDLFGTAVGFGPAALGIGGSTGLNVARWGARTGGGHAGRGADAKFRGIGSYVTDELPELLRKTPSGLGQILGIIAGAIAPTAGAYFWDDVWQGEGNILQRGQRWISHVLSPDALWEMVKDAVEGIMDTVKALFNLVKNAVTDPKGVFNDALAQVRELFGGAIDMVRDTLSGLREIMTNPAAFAREVWDHFYERAKEAMPNTEGLFAFAGGGIVPGYRPGVDSVRALLSPGEAVLRPEAVRALGYRTVLGLNRAGELGLGPLAAPPELHHAVRQGNVLPAGAPGVRPRGAAAGPRYEIHVHEAKSETTTQSVLRAMQYAEAMYGRL